MGIHMQNDRTPLHIFQRASVTKLLREIILDHVCLFRVAIGPEFLFVGDNSRPHRNAEVSHLLKNENVNRMQWFESGLEISGR